MDNNTETQSNSNNRPTAGQIIATAISDNMLTIIIFLSLIIIILAKKM